MARARIDVQSLRGLKARYLISDHRLAEWCGVQRQDMILLTTGRRGGMGSKSKISYF